MEGPQPAVDPLSRRIRHLALDPVLGDVGAARLVRFGIAIITFATVAFVAWSSVAVLEEITVAPGTIAPAQDMLIVQHFEGGIVKELLVEEGQVVERGQPLARFDATAAGGDLKQALIRRAKLVIQAERLLAFAENRPFNEAITVGYADQKMEQARVLESKNTSRGQQRNVIAEQIKRDEAELSGLSNEIVEVLHRIDMAKEQASIREELFHRGNGSRVVMLESQKDLGLARQALAELASKRDTAGRRVEESRNRLVELDGRLRADALAERAEALSQLAEIDETIGRLRDRVNRLEVYSPAAAIVQTLPVKTAGAVVQPGGVIAQLVPVEGGLVGEARISTRDIGFVAIGQPVQIKIGTYNFVRYGGLEGRIEGISATTFLGTDAVPYYKARIKLNQLYLGQNPVHNRVLPGMTMTADIRTGGKTVLEYLLKPIRTAFATAFHER